MELVFGRVLGKGGTLFRDLSILKWGDGSCIKFWHDPWCGGLSLKDNFPELYGIASD